MIYVDVKIVIVVMLSSMIFLFRDHAYGRMAGGLFSIDRELERERENCFV